MKPDFVKRRMRQAVAKREKGRREEHVANGQQPFIVDVSRGGQVDATCKGYLMLRTSPRGLPATPWAQGGLRSDAWDLWCHW